MNSLLRREIKDSRLTFVSFTRVELNQDYSLAKIYWDTFDPSKKTQISEALEKVGSRFRSLLAKRLQVRHTPSLKFFYDSQFEDELKIDKLISEES